MDEGMDTGRILLTKQVNIEPEEPAGRLHDRLALIGADLVLETISALKTGTAVPRPQPEEGVSLAPLLKKSDGLIDWTRPADELAFLVRGLDPWPGAFTLFRGQHLKVFGAKAGPGRGEPGRILALHQGRLHVAAGRGSLGLAELQLAGKRKQSAADFWRGQRLSPSDEMG
ncbi:MAG: methionyl-tRNA formyltransferase, partial [Pseudomonadota bacterium]